MVTSLEVPECIGEDRLIEPENRLYAVAGLEDIEAPEVKGIFCDTVLGSIEQNRCASSKPIKLGILLNGGIVPFLMTIEAMMKRIDKGEDADFWRGVLQETFSLDENRNLANIILAGKKPDNTFDREEKYNISGRVEPDDFLIIPEDIGDQLRAVEGVREAMLTQNGYSPGNLRIVCMFAKESSRGKIEADADIKAVHYIPDLPVGEPKWIKGGGGMNSQTFKQSDDTEEDKFRARLAARQRFSRYVYYTYSPDQDQIRAQDEVDLVRELEFLNDKYLISLANKEDFTVENGTYFLRPLDLAYQLELFRMAGDVSRQFELMNQYLTALVVKLNPQF